VACPYTSNYVYLTESVKKMISEEKKPRLFERVRGENNSELVEAMKDALMIPQSKYQRLSDDQALKLVTMGFRIIYDNKFVIGIEHL
jgi:homoserine trans-succinylase